VAASVNSPRIEQIARCCAELARLRTHFPCGPCDGVAVGEMDWLEELHRLLYEDQHV
jgi:hypothetical protein